MSADKMVNGYIYIALISKALYKVFHPPTHTPRAASYHLGHWPTIGSMWVQLFIFVIYTVKCENMF